MFRRIKLKPSLLLSVLLFAIPLLANADSDDSVRKVVAVQQAQIDILRSDLVQARAEITALQSKVSTLEANVSSLTSTTNNHTSELADLKNRLTTLERSETVAGLTSRVSTLESIVPGLASKAEANWASGLQGSFRHPIAYYIPGERDQSCTSKCEQYSGKCVNAFDFDNGDIRGCESTARAARKCLCAKNP